MLALLTMASALASCRVEDARYVLRTAPEVTAQFRIVNSGPDWPSGLALRIHFAKGDKAYWFLPFDGGTDDLQTLASTTDADRPDWRPPSSDGGPRPLGDLGYIAVDETYRVMDATPRPGGSAPAHFLIPDLGDRVWHDGFVRAPKQFFDLKGCAARR